MTTALIYFPIWMVLCNCQVHRPQDFAPSLFPHRTCHLVYLWIYKSCHFIKLVLSHTSYPIDKTLLECFIKCGKSMASYEKATTRARPTTVRFDPSTNAKPWKFNLSKLHLLQTSFVFKDPPRPVGCTSVISRIHEKSKQKK